MPKDLQKLKKSQINEVHDYVACLTGNVSGILDLDFDDIDDFNDIYYRKYHCKGRPRVRTKKGVHVYHRLEDRFTELPSKFGKIDLQGNGKCVYFPPAKYVDGEGRVVKYEWVELTTLPPDVKDGLKTMPDKLFNHLMSGKVNADIKKAMPTPCVADNEEQEKSQPVAKKQSSFVELFQKKQLVDLIATESYLTDRVTWMKIVFEMRNEELSEEFARTISIKTHNYTDKRFDEIWGYERNVERKAVGGTLVYYARLSNEEAYLRLFTKRDKRSAIDCTDYALSNQFDELVADDLI